MLYLLASLFPSDAALVGFAVFGLLVTVGTLAALVGIGARTVIRTRRVNRRAVIEARSDSLIASARDPFHALYRY